jgi:hypothetical protein
MEDYGILFSKYFNYFSSSQMHISLPAVTSTSHTTYSADDRTTNKEQQTFRHIVVVAIVDIW